MERKKRKKLKGWKKRGLLNSYFWLRHCFKGTERRQKRKQKKKAEKKREKEGRTKGEKRWTKMRSWNRATNWLGPALDERKKKKFPGLQNFKQ